MSRPRQPADEAAPLLAAVLLFYLGCLLMFRRLSALLGPPAPRPLEDADVPPPQAARVILDNKELIREVLSVDSVVGDQQVSCKINEIVEARYEKERLKKALEPDSAEEGAATPKVVASHGKKRLAPPPPSPRPRSAERPKSEIVKSVKGTDSPPRPPGTLKRPAPQPPVRQRSSPELKVSTLERREFGATAFELKTKFLTGEGNKLCTSSSFSQFSADTTRLNSLQKSCSFTPVKLNGLFMKDESDPQVPKVSETVVVTKEVVEITNRAVVAELKSVIALKNHTEPVVEPTEIKVEMEPTLAPTCESKSRGPAPQQQHVVGAEANAKPVETQGCSPAANDECVSGHHQVGGERQDEVVQVPHAAAHQQKEKATVASASPSAASECSALHQVSEPQVSIPPPETIEQTADKNNKTEPLAKTQPGVKETDVPNNLSSENSTSDLVPVPAGNGSEANLAAIATPPTVVANSTKETEAAAVENNVAAAVAAVAAVAAPVLKRSDLKKSTESLASRRKRLTAAQSFDKEEKAESNLIKKIQSFLVTENGEQVAMAEVKRSGSVCSIKKEKCGEKDKVEAGSTDAIKNGEQCGIQSSTHNNADKKAKQQDGGDDASTKLAAGKQPTQATPVKIGFGALRPRPKSGPLTSDPLPLRPKSDELSEVFNKIVLRKAEESKPAAAAAPRRNSLKSKSVKKPKAKDGAEVNGVKKSAKSKEENDKTSVGAEKSETLAIVEQPSINNTVPAKPDLCAAAVGVAAPPAQQIISDSAGAQTAKLDIAPDNASSAEKKSPSEPKLAPAKEPERKSPAKQIEPIKLPITNGQLNSVAALNGEKSDREVKPDAASPIIPEKSPVQIEQSIAPIKEGEVSKAAESEVKELKSPAEIVQLKCAVNENETILPVNGAKNEEAVKVIDKKPLSINGDSIIVNYDKSIKEEIKSTVAPEVVEIVQKPPIKTDQLDSATSVKEEKPPINGEIPKLVASTIEEKLPMTIAEQKVTKEKSPVNGQISKTDVKIEAAPVDQNSLVKNGQLNGTKNEKSPVTELTVKDKAREIDRKSPVKIILSKSASKEKSPINTEITKIAAKVDVAAAVKEFDRKSPSKELKSKSLTKELNGAAKPASKLDRKSPMKDVERKSPFKEIQPKVQTGRKSPVKDAERKSPVKEVAANKLSGQAAAINAAAAAAASDIKEAAKNNSGIKRENGLDGAKEEKEPESSTVRGKLVLGQKVRKEASPKKVQQEDDEPAKCMSERAAKRLEQVRAAKSEPVNIPTTDTEGVEEAPGDAANNNDKEGGIGLVVANTGRRVSDMRFLTEMQVTGIIK